MNFEMKRERIENEHKKRNGNEMFDPLVFRTCRASRIVICLAGENIITFSIDAAVIIVRFDFIAIVSPT